MHAVDPSVALFDVYPMAQVRWLRYWMYIMWSTMFGVLGIIAVFTAAVGVYGVAYYTSTQRTREIGIRVALGAGRAQVVRPILRQSAILCGIGLAIGLLAARAVTPVVGQRADAGGKGQKPGHPFYSAARLHRSGSAIASRRKQVQWSCFPERLPVCCSH